MTDFLELARRRVSVRSFHPERPVPDDDLQAILEAGRLAPSAANRQPWRFLVIRSREALDRIRACYDATWFRHAPVVLAVVGREEEAWVRRTDGYNALETDLTIAMDHMILAAADRGVGSCWIAAFDPPTLRTALDLAEDEQVYAITPLGYPEEGWEPREKKRKSTEDVVRYL